MKTIGDFIKELNDKFPKENSWDEVFVFTNGRKFYKICRSKDGNTPTSSYAFVDVETGDLYKAASWNAPAKGIRGSIHDTSGLDACEKYSVKYLR